MSALSSGEAQAGRRRAAQMRRSVGLVSLGWAGVLALAAIWQLVAAILDKPVFPTFTASASAAWTILTTGDFGSDLLPSIVRFAIGFALSAAIGVVLGLLLGYVRWLGDCFAALTDFLRALPTPLFIPLAVLIFGFGGNMVIFVIIAGAIWPVLVNVHDATRRVDPVQLDVARVCGLRGIRLFWNVLLPATVPSMLAGLRIALSVCLALLVVAEMLGAQNGIGHVIQTAQQNFDIPGTYGGVIILGCAGLVFDTLFLLGERRWASWVQGALRNDNA